MRTLRCVMEPKAYCWHHKRLGPERGDLAETNTTAHLASHSLLLSLSPVMSHLSIAQHVGFIFLFL